MTVRSSRSGAAGRKRRRWLDAQRVLRCAYCRSPLWRAAAQVEHKVPVSRGGVEHPANYLVEPCNQERKP